MSTECSVIGPATDENVPINVEIVPANEEMARDYTDVFTTEDYFETRQKLEEWVRARGAEYGIVIVVGRSDTGGGMKTPRLLLVCERSGQYREYKSKSSRLLVENVEELDELKNKKKSRVRRETGTKKCGCPFRLKARQISHDGEWALEVVCGVHNHPIAQYLEGHSYAGRLSHVEEDFVLDMSKTNTKPKDILFMLHKKFPDNKSTMRTIYNARVKHNVVEQGGQTQLQYLMSKLNENGYYYHHRRCEKTDTIKDIFFAHPISVQLLRAFPKVIQMDCTYKTNRYRLPLLEIVGVTSTAMTFCVACAYLESEREDNYIWACTILKTLMDQTSLPTIIITDRDLAIMNAVEVTFPTSRHFLCRWHIGKNIMANCKKLFGTKEKWASFYSSWNSVVYADTEPTYYELLKRFQYDYSGYPAGVQYAMEQWIHPYKERFVSAWTNNVMHYDNTTTNRYFTVKISASTFIYVF